MSQHRHHTAESSTGRDSGPDAPDIDPTELLELATSLAEQAGQLLLDGLGEVRMSISTKSSSTDMVTEMDRASEALLVDGILSVRPNDAILAEEGSDKDGSSGVRWVIDPLDGTTNYLYGHPGFAVSVAAEILGRAVAAVVVDPMAGDVFTAVKDSGASRNGHRITASPQTELAHALVATGFSYDPSRRVSQAGVVTATIASVRDIRRMGAAAVDLCSVACGRVDAYYERGLQPWDHAAGVLIAREAGAVVGDLYSGPASGDFCLASAPGIFDELRRKLREVGAQEP